MQPAHHSHPQGVRGVVERLVAQQPEAFWAQHTMLVQLGDKMALVREGQVVHVLATAGSTQVRRRLRCTGRAVLCTLCFAHAAPLLLGPSCRGSCLSGLLPVGSLPACAACCTARAPDAERRLVPGHRPPWQRPDCG